MGAYIATTNSHFGIVPADFSYDDVLCEGSQATTLDQCPHNNIENCGAGEGAGAYCYNGVPIGNAWNQRF